MIHTNEPFNLDEEGIREAIANVGKWIDIEIRKVKHKSKQELDAQVLKIEKEYLIKTKKQKGFKMITTLLLLAALSVSVYMNYKKGVTFSEVISSGKELLQKAKHELVHEHKEQTDTKDTKEEK